ncbi:hypothetical protein [Streptomyces sp. NPDC096351]|uniref:hypothetical protein n=1 Tax=Streptomyces sp. NPDC096351 TaxID=3366087 RepID=UPI0037FB27CF
MHALRASITGGLTLGLVVITATGALGTALVAAAAATAVLALGAHLGTRLLHHHTNKYPPL